MRNSKYVTKLEKEVIANIINSDYMDARGEQMILWGVWSFSATNERKQLAGALGSLVKKGLCACDYSEEMETCMLTKEGYAWAKHNGLCK